MILGLGFGVVLPVIALVVGTGVLGSEIDDGTVAHILAKPLPRSEIILSKLVVAVVVTARDGRRCRCTRSGCSPARRARRSAWSSARRWARAAYCALFLALSLLTRRPVLLGLVYVLIWEGLLTNCSAAPGCSRSSSTW